MKECSQKELAAYLDCSVVTIRSYERRGWVKRRQNGKYNLEASLKSVITRLRELAGARNNGGGLADARAGLAHAQCEASTWKLERAKGDYVEANAVIRLLRDDFAVQRTLLLALARQLPKQLAGLNKAEMEIVLEREVYDALSALADPQTYSRN